MSTITLDREVTSTARATEEHAPIPMTRLVSVELSKMFDTRSGFWLMTSIGILATIATAATIIFAPRDELTYETFATAIGFPIAIILPIIAILSVTSEWSQRSGLTSFTLVPHRSRVISAKLIGSTIIGAVSVLLALAIGAVGNVIGTTIAGVDQVWNISIGTASMIVLANVLGLMMGFTLGVLIRSSAGAIVAYFVYSFVLPTLLMLLATSQKWFADMQGWVDFNFSTVKLFDGNLVARDWAELAVSGTIWLLIPLLVGLRLVLRSEVK